MIFLHLYMQVLMSYQQKRVWSRGLTSRTRMLLIVFPYLRKKVSQGIKLIGAYAHYIRLKAEFIVENSYVICFFVPASFKKL